MVLQTGKDLKSMLRLGWNIIQANPSIGFNALVTELEATTNFTQAEWMDGLLALSELGYFPSDAQWADARAWFLAQDSETAGFIAGAIQYHFPHSPAMQIQLLSWQRDLLVTGRDGYVDEVQNALDPFIASPGGADSRVVAAVQARRDELVAFYQQVVARIADIDARLAELRA